jgi:hypothetical protein
MVTSAERPDTARLEEAVISQLKASDQGLEVDDLIARVVEQTGQSAERIQEVVWGLIDARRVSVGWDTRLSNPAQTSARGLRP